MAEKVEKKVTLKSIQTRIDKINAQINKKNEDIAKLREDIKALEAELKECNNDKKKLEKEQLKKQLENSLFDDVTSVEDINKIIALGNQVKGKIGDIDIEDIVTAINMVVEDKKKTVGTANGTEDTGR